MENKDVVFRGLNNGIYINTDLEDLIKIKSSLKKILDEKRDFYRGAVFLGVNSDKLSDYEKLDISFYLKYNYDMEIDETSLMKSIEHEELEPEEEEPEEVDEGYPTRFVNRTIRSGQAETYDGNLIIIGDVNSGALVEASGNIVVLGSFRGVGHAGASGDLEAIVASYNLCPTQLRIADKIARSPDEKKKKLKDMPEIARIVEGQVIIEPYLLNK